MRSKKLTVGIALAASTVVALALAAWATGAVQSSAAAPVGRGANREKHQQAIILTTRRLTNSIVISVSY